MMDICLIHFSDGKILEKKHKKRVEISAPIPVAIDDKSKVTSLKDISSLRHLAVSTPNLSKIDEGRKQIKSGKSTNSNNNKSFNGDLRRPWVAHRIKSSKSSVDVSGKSNGAGLTQIMEDSSDDDISVIDMCQDGDLER